MRYSALRLAIIGGLAIACAQGIAGESSPPQGQADSSVAVVGPIATGEGTSPGVRAEIQELKRTGGDTVTLKFTVVNDGANGLLVEPRNVKLVDMTNKKIYGVMKTDMGDCLCSAYSKLESQSRGGFWARYPAPRVAAVTVQIDNFLPIDNVPISP